MRLSVLLALAVTVLCSAASAQTIAVDANDPARLSVTTTPAKSGDTLRIYSSPTSRKCGVLSTQLSLVPATSDVVGAGATTELELTAPLPAKSFVCVVVISSADGKTVTTGKEFPTPAAAPDPTVTPLIKPAPAVGQDTLTIVTAPASAGDTIAVYSPAALTTCDTKTPLKITGSTAVLAGTQTTVLMTDKFAAGKFVCVVLAGKYTSAPVAVAATAAPPAAAANTSSPKIQFQGPPAAGSRTIMVGGDPNVTVAVYQFDTGYLHTGKQCDATSIADGTPLSIVSGTNTGLLAPASTSASSPYALTFPDPLSVGTQLCLVATDSNKALGYSSFATVVDTTDYGRFRAMFTAGAMISNQQSSSNSTTAGEYLDMELVSALVRGGSRACTNLQSAEQQAKNLPPAGCRMANGQNGKTSFVQSSLWRPGWDTFFDARISPTPVATQTTTTISSTTTTSLNVLTSQQALRVIVGTEFPFRFRGWNNRTNAFTFGPVAKASFDTILNPSVGSNANSATSQTTGNFSSVYSSWLVGTRMSWDQFPASTDQSPRTWAEINTTLGKYSNLPSYECVGTDKGGAPPPKTTTACSTGTAPNVSRVLVMRFDIAGFVKFPNHPFVLGFDANLAQYGLPGTPNNIDYLNKPGNDVRIYIAYTIDLSSAFKLF